MLLDFGPGSVDAWLAWLVASELRISDEQSARYIENRQMVLDSANGSTSHPYRAGSTPVALRRPS
jgi:hypothetical protein